MMEEIGEDISGNINHFIYYEVSTPIREESSKALFVKEYAARFGALYEGLLPSHDFYKTDL